MPGAKEVGVRDRAGRIHVSDTANLDKRAEETHVYERGAHLRL